MIKTCVVIPTYNEEGNVKSLIGKLLQLKLDLNIIIVDGHSTDETGSIADSLAQQYAQVKVIHQTAKLGLGSGYKEGFTKALAGGYDYIFTMDADFSHDPSYIPDILEQVKENDVVIGSRYVPGGGVKNWGLLRRLLSWGANTLARLMLGFKTADNTAGFRCYRKEVLEVVDFTTIKSNGYSYLLEMLYRCKEKKFRIKEVPIIFVNRYWGQTKISRKEIVKAITTLARLFFVRCSKGHR